jgi:monofunctional biosynthetic peptidoglycan transglycosylase
MASRPRRRSLTARLFRWLFFALLIFLIGSTAWVFAYRYIDPPITFTQMGDVIEVRAAVAGEDSKFCSHSGFDQQAIEAAMRRNAAGGRTLRGGSTISQQTAKNAFLWQGGGYFRKGLEAWFTLLIENLWSKQRIMEVYLNVAETGIGTYGVNAGAMRYYGHDASDLTPLQAARMAAVFPLPKRRAAIAPAGFTRRYGNLIAARIPVVARERLDRCI